MALIFQFFKIIILTFFGSRTELSVKH